MDPEVYSNLINIGGPVLALASLVVVLMFKHMGSLVTVFQNHIAHAEKETTKNTEVNRATGASIDRLVDRIDRVLLNNDDG